MAVLIEAVSVIVRRDAIDGKLVGGWEAFAALAPGATLCADADLARVGFATPDAAQVFVTQLETRGLRHEQDGRALDMALVDQVGGFTLTCDWAEFGQVCTGGAQEWVAACRRLGSSSQEVMTPQGWRYQGSISQRLGALRFEPRRRP